MNKTTQEHSVILDFEDAFSSRLNAFLIHDASAVQRRIIIIIYIYIYIEHGKVISLVCPSVNCAANNSTTPNCVCHLDISTDFLLMSDKFAVKYYSCIASSLVSLEVGVNWVDGPMFIVLVGWTSKCLQPVWTVHIMPAAQPCLRPAAQPRGAPSVQNSPESHEYIAQIVQQSNQNQNADSNTSLF